MHNLGIPVEMIQMVRKGRYAVDPYGTEKLIFVRVAEIVNKNSIYKGYLVIQSQHSDDLVTRARLSPNGNKIETFGWTDDKIRDVILAIITDPWGAAIKYGQELGQCCRCGKTLTDDRSRWYGIGPECEKLWPEVIAEVDDVRGVYEETLV